MRAAYVAALIIARPEPDFLSKEIKSSRGVQIAGRLIMVFRDAQIELSHLSQQATWHLAFHEMIQT
jgi:hypothetical protein